MNAPVAESADLPAKPGSRTFVVLALTAIVVASVALRAWRLEERSVSFDEAFSWRLASFSWSEMLGRAILDNNPPLYYVLLKAWIACLGDSATAMRSLSVVTGAASCVGVYLMVTEAYREKRGLAQPAAGDTAQPAAENTAQPAAGSTARWIGLFAAALVAVASLQIRWGWDARMYSLGAALAAFSSWLLLRALHVGGSAPPFAAPPFATTDVPRLADSGEPAVPGGAIWRAWVLYAAVALAFAYTHTYALLSLAAQAMFTAGYLLVEARWRPATLVASRRFRAAVVGFSLIAAGWLPWLPVVLRQQAQVREAFWIEPLTRWSVPDICRQMFADPEAATTNHRAAAIAAAACAAVLLSLLRRPCRGDWLLWLSAVMPMALAVVISTQGGNISQVRYFVFAQVFLLAALAALIGRISRWRIRTIAAAVVLSQLVLLHVGFVQRLDVRLLTCVRAAAEHVAAHREPGEPVIVSNPFFYLPALYHLRSPPPETRRGDPNCHLLHPGRPLLHYEGTAALAPRDLIESKDLGAWAGDRVWVVGNLDGRPSGWRELSRTAFYERAGVQLVVVTEFATRPATRQPVAFHPSSFISSSVKVDGRARP